MRKIYVTLLLSLTFISIIDAQVWQAVGDPNGISAGNVGRLSIACDNNDNLVVGYYDLVATKGSVQKFEGTEWNYIGEQGMTASYATFNSLAVNSSNTPFFTNQGNGLEVRMFNGVDWEQLPNPTNSTINYQASYFSDDDILFVVSNENNGTVKKFVNGSWEQVGNSGFSSGALLYLDMAIGSDGKIYISFDYGGFVHVYENDVDASSSDPWEPVGGIANLAATPCSENYNSSLEVDGNNNLYVAYVSNSQKKLSVKKFDGSDWSQLGNENFTDEMVQHVSISIGDNNIVYVAVSNWGDEDFLRNYVMAYDEDNESWYQAGTGFASLGQATNNSLTTDSNGNLYLAFSDDTYNHKLLVQTLNLNLVAPESVEISTENGVDPVIDEDNGSLQLLATVLPEDANQSVIWSIEEGETFATIDENGLLTAIASNTTVTIKAQCSDNLSIFDLLDVTIINQDSDIEAEEIIVSTENNVYPDIYSLNDNLQLIATTYPPEADQYTIWTIEEGDDVLSVDENGLVNPISEGVATIRATHIDGSVYDEINVYVWENGCAQGIETMLFGSGYDITAGQMITADDFVVQNEMMFSLNVLRLQLIFTDDEISNIDLVFYKDDNGQPGEEIAVINGLTPVNQNFIYDWADLGTQYEIELYIEDPIVFSQGTYWFSPRATASDGASVYWDDTVYGNIGSNLILFSNEHNWVPAGFGGMDGVFHMAGNCTNMPILVSIADGEDDDIFIGEEVQLEATIVEEGLSDEVVWSVESGLDYASVDQNGMVYGMEVGPANIRATSVDDANAYDGIDINVHHPDECSQGVYPFETIENAYSLGNGIRLAVDLTVEENHTFTINSLSLNPANFGTSFNFIFYKDVEGLPGETIVASAEGTVVHDMYRGYEYEFIFHEYLIELNNPVSLNSGTFWMELTSDVVGWEATSNNVIGNPGVFASESTGGEWTYSSTGLDFVYELNGLCQLSTNTENEILSKNDGIEVYPNPTTDQLFISLNNSKYEEVEYLLYDIFGHLHQNKYFAWETIIDVSNLSKGVYFLELKLGDKTEVRKVVVN